MQKKIYDACAKNDMEKRIIEVIFGSPKLEEATVNKTVKKDLIDKLGYWRKCMGTSANLSVDDKQITFDVDFLCKYFKDITLKEMDWMVELYIQRLLPMEYPIYVSFNPDYLARVIHAYRLYKAEKSRRLEEAVQKRTLERKSTPQESVETFTWMMEELRKDIDNEVLVPKFVEDVYKVLRRIGLLDTGTEQAEEAKAFAMKRILLLKQSSYTDGPPHSIRDLLQPSATDAENKQQLFVHLYSIIEFFKQKDLAMVASRIEEKHFINV